MQRTALLWYHSSRSANALNALQQGISGTGPKCTSVTYKQRVMERILHHFCFVVLRPFELPMSPPRPPHFNIACSKACRRKGENTLARNKWCNNFSIGRAPTGSYMHNVKMRGDAGEIPKALVRKCTYARTSGAYSSPTPAKQL